MELLFLLLLAAGLWALIGPLWTVATADRLRAEVRELRGELARLRDGAPAPAERMAMPEPPSTEAVAPEPLAAPGPPPAPVAAREGFEQRLAQRWLVWLGGIALAMGGAFAVKAAADQGWLGPLVRLSLALVLGAGLVGVGERLRRQGTDGYVPAAVAAAGLCTLFAAFWGGHALYGLLPSGAAFVLLAAVAALAVLLSWAHGPFLAALGIGGAFAIPLLASGPTSSSWALCAYLLLPTAGGLAVLRYRAWPWLAWSSLAGASVWLALGIVLPVGHGAAGTSFALAIAALFLLAPLWAMPGPDGGPAPALRRACVAAVCAVALAMSIKHGLGQPAAVETVGLILLCLMPLAVSRIWAIPAATAVVPATAALLALATWQLEPVAIGLELTGDAALALPPLRLLPEEAGGYVGWAVAIAALYGLTGLAFSRGERPGLWASLSAAVPVLTLAILFLRLSDLTPSLSWAMTALAVALLELGAAAEMQRRGRAAPALAAYAVGTAAALALAFTFALEKAWLTVALAALLPALGWVWRRLGVAGLRTVALALAIVVVARIGFAPEIGGMLDGPAPALGWTLYGLGLPLLAFMAAARLLSTGRADRLAATLATGALLLWLVLAWALVRWLRASLGESVAPPGLAEWSLHALVWLATGLGLLRRDGIRPWMPTRLGAALLCGLGAYVVLVGHLLDLNPLLTGEPVGSLPFANTLLLAYGLPALLLGLVARELRRQRHSRLAGTAAVLALGLGLAWLGLELRRAFHGTDLSGDTIPAETWAYTVLLLLYAAGLLLAGILRHGRPLRLASLAVLMLAIAKAFLLDMADLDGLWRAASFLGLGGCLVAIGLVYQRFVFERPADATT
jgi:uncharacterized membrane protein